MRPVQLAPLCLIAFFVTGCSSIQVSYDYNPSANFTSYGTFRLVTPGGKSQGARSQDPLFQQRAERAIAFQLEGKGLREVPSRPDLKVFLHTRFSKQKQVRYYDTGWGYRWGWGTHTSVRTVETIPLGTIMVDLVDAKLDELVWRGTASLRIDSEKDAEQRVADVNEAVAKIFEKFPPR